MEPRLRSRALLAAALLLAACRTTAPPPSYSLPDPLAPPLAGDPLTPQQAKTATAAWDGARRGDARTVEKQLAKLPAGHPVRELIAIEARLVGGEAVSGAALDLARRNPGYAAAWSVAALGAQLEGRDEDALAAARQALALRDDPPNGELVAALERGVVAAGVAEAGAMLARGDATDALARAMRVLEHVPEADAARLIAVRAALAAGRTTQAAQLLPALPDSPAGLETKGRVAEALGQWDLASEFYGRLPGEYPGRCELLEGAREQARLSLAPPQVTSALASPAVTRRQLAAILVWEEPLIPEKAAGPVPVFEDIVGLAEGRDIVLAVRAGVMTGDAVARRFGANRTVSLRDLQSCLDRLAQLAGRPAPRWCAEGASGDECLARPATLDGKTVAGLVRSVAAQEENPCSRR